MTSNISYPRRLLATLAALAAFTLLPLPAAAEIVGTDEITAPSPADAERAKVQTFLEQATVVDKLKAMGVDGLSAKDRVAAMSQEEVHALAQRIEALPAGGDFSNSDLVIILLVAILLAILL